MIFKKSTEGPDVRWIDSADQLALLESPVRQEILDTIEATGPCSVPEVARALGRPAAGLYYHVDLLVEGDLLRQAGTRETPGREATLYGLPAPQLRLRYPLDDPAGRERIRRIASAMIRVAERDFEAGMEHRGAEAEGEGRNLWAARLKGRLSAGELRELNELLDRLTDLFSDKPGRGEGQLVTLTWLLSPVEDRPTRG